jgi:hypothetical protein
MGQHTDILLLCDSKGKSGIELYLDLLAASFARIAGITSSFILADELPENEIITLRKKSAFIVFLRSDSLLSQEFVKRLSFLSAWENNHANGKTTPPPLILVTTHEAMTDAASLIKDAPGLKVEYCLDLIENIKPGIVYHPLLFDSLVDISYTLRRYYAATEAMLDSSVKQCIFLAETSPDAAHYRLALQNELEMLGFAVVPEEHTRQTEDLIDPKVEEQLSRSILSVQIIGREYGPEIPGNRQSVPEWMHQLASKHTGSLSQKEENKSLHRIIWIAPANKTIDPRQEQFIAKIRTETMAFAGTELLETPFESLKSFIHGQLNILKTKSESKEKDSGSVYLVYEKRIEPDIQPLLNNIQEFEPQAALPGFNLSPEESMHRHKSLITGCRSIIIFYEGGNAFWLRAKMNDVLKANGFGRKLDWNARIVVAPKGTAIENKHQFQLIEFNKKIAEPEILQSIKLSLKNA